jgi:hypothetical protein
MRKNQTMKFSARRIVRSTTLAALLAATGCAHRAKPVAQAPHPSEQSMDMATVDAIGDSAVRAGIVVQHTLFPYHFGADSARLNDLGSDDLAVLISHWRSENGGDLNVRRGDVSEELYTARVHYVQEQLKLAGIEVNRVRISDGLPGGEGMASTNVQRALDRELKQGAFQAVDNTKSVGTGSSTGGASTPVPTGVQQ